jgi:hypothetical protein
MKGRDGEHATTKESTLRTVKPGDFHRSLKERIQEGSRVKGTMNAQKIYLSASRNPKMEAVNRKMHLTKEEKEELIAEMTRKRKFVGEIKELIDGTNFSVGTEDPNFDRKVGATIDDPNYNMTVVSPWPHKNTSTLKVKYGDSSTYARPEPHSNTMDVNRMDSNTLSLTDRPKFFSHLKQTSIKYPQTSVREHSEPDRKYSSAKKTLQPREPLFRNVPYSSGVR